MSKHTGDYSRDTYASRASVRRATEAREAADAIRRHLAAVEAERDQLREHADRLAAAIGKGRQSFRHGTPELGRGGWEVYFDGESWTEACRAVTEYREARK